MPGAISVLATSNQDINGLLSGIRWNATSLTFSFPTSASFYGVGYGNGEPANSFQSLNATQQASARSILTTYSSYVSMTFSEITESASAHADLRFAQSNAPSTAWAYYPSSSSLGGDSWYNYSSGYYANPVRGNYAWATFEHEIGHALGLEHGHEGGDYGPMTYAHDSMEYSVMTYRSYEGASTTTGYANEAWGFAQTPMMYDIAALQFMYGANFNANSGSTVYSWSPTSGEMFINGVGQGAPGGNRVFQTVWDGGGADTYDFSNYSSALTVSLLPGEWTITTASQLARLHWDGSRIADGNIANALLFNDDARSLIENARGGSGSDVIVGNRASNVLWGSGGDDYLNGREGQDSAGYSGLSTQYRWWQNADRSYTITDLRTGSPDGTDTLVSIDTFVFQDTIVHLQDLSRTVAVYDTNNDYSWAQATSVYDGAGALDFVTIKNDNGQVFFTDYDQDSVFTWREAISAYDAQNRLDYVSIKNDNSRVLFTYYDPYNARTWSEAISGYDAQNRLDYVTVEFDDGTSAYTEYDQENASNVNYGVYHYDVSNHLVRSFVAYDDGSTLTI